MSYQMEFISNISVTTEGYGNISYIKSPEHSVIDMLHIYLIPIIVFLGIMGNTVSILIFTLTYLNRQSSSAYLAFLAFVDSVFLICLLIGWFGYLRIHLFHRQGWCQFVIYMSYVSAFLSVWTVVSFSVERYIVVFYPLHKNRYCTKKRSFIVLGSLTALALVFYSFSLWTSTVTLHDKYKTQTCLVIDDYYQLVHIFSSVDTVITLIIPSTLIIVFNTAIACKVRMFTKRHREDTANSMADSDCGYELDHAFYRSGSRRRTCNDRSAQAYICSPRYMVRVRAQMRTTRALLAISTVFVLLNLPSHAFRIYVFVKQGINPDATKLSKQEWQVQEFLLLLYYINFAANFVLYSAWSANFRRAVGQSSRKIKSRLASVTSSRIWRFRANSPGKTDGAVLKTHSERGLPARYSLNINYRYNL